MVIEEIIYGAGESQGRRRQDDGRVFSEAGLVPEERCSRLAGPQDRLAAVVADLVLFSPLVSLAASPYRRMAFEAELRGRTDDRIFAILLGAGAGALLWMVLNTVFVSAFGATPGKIFFGLRVESLWGSRRVRPLSALMRSVAWILECACAGIPFIAVSANERRRPLHDRLADTVVVSVRERGAAGPPGLAEISMASGVHSALLLIITSLCVTAFLHLRPGADDPTGPILALENEGVLCPSVGEARGEWMSPGPRPSRLAVALAMYGADVIGEDCLQAEAEWVFLNQGRSGSGSDSDLESMPSRRFSEETSLAYLAKALVHSDDSRLYEEYLSKSCREPFRSPACALARLIRLEETRSHEIEDTADKAAQVESETDAEVVVSSLSERDPAYLKIWVIRYFMETRQYDRALIAIDQMAPERKVGSFFGRQRTRALWGLGLKDQARLAMRSAMDTLEPGERVELARWFCFNETAQGCSEQSRQSCGLLRSAVASESSWLESAEVAAAYIRGESCQGGWNEKRLRTLQEKIPSPDAKAYLGALALLQGDNAEGGIGDLKKIASMSRTDNPFFFEANLRLAQLAKTPEELETIQKTWSELDRGSEGWTHLGLKLMDRFKSWGLWNRILEVGFKMVESERFDRDLYRSMVVAAFRAGNRRMAMGLLERLSRLDQSSIMTDRGPASVGEFEDVRQELLAKKETRP